MKIIQSLRSRFASTPKLYEGLTQYIDINQLTRYVQLLVWALGIKHPKDYFVLADRIVKLYRQNGPNYTANYLKEVVRLIQKYVSGNKEHVSLGVTVGIVRGLPKIIPRDLRLLIRSLDSVAIRATLSLVSIYRIMKCIPKLKIQTITSPFGGLYKELPIIEIAVVVRKFKFKLQEPRFLMLFSAGPNHNPSALGLPLDAKAYILNPQIFEAYERLANRINGAFLLSQLKEEMEAVRPFPLEPKKLERLSLGKLSFKEEAAGKVRVFAIVDGWTQSLLSGLHDSIGHILRSIEQDGTFDQRAPIEKLMKTKPTELYSFDLSAATDRLPIDLQVQVLSLLIGRKGAEAWRDLLVMREYRAVAKQYNINTKLKYAVGQPMGALSSFAMLGLTHHVIIQIAARRAGIDGWFTNYALLGDDIMIADKAVANIYRQIMCDLGMEINLHKSLISSKGVGEFAKRLVSPEAEYTPIGPKNILMALTNYQFIPNLFVDLHNKGYELTSTVLEERFSKLPLTFVKGRKNLRNVLLWTVQGPFGFISTGTRLTPEIQVVNSFNPIWLGNLLARIRFTMFKLHSKEWQSAISKLQQLYYGKIVPMKDVPVPGFSQCRPGWEKDIVWRVVSDTEKKSLLWSALPSYDMIKLLYELSITRLWKAKPYVNPGTLTKVDMLKVYTLQDVITPEFDVKGPVELALGDITANDPVSLNKFKDKRPSELFFKEFKKLHHNPDHILSRPIV